MFKDSPRSCHHTLFFSALQKINAQFAPVFEPDVKEGNEEDQGQGEEEPDKDTDAEDGRDDSYIWFSLIEAVSETTKFDFDHIFQMPIVETLAYLSYIKIKRAKEAAQIRRLKAKH